MSIRDILVTGGAGYIGSHLVDALVARDYRVTVLDNLEPQVHRSGTWPSLRQREGDVRQRRRPRSLRCSSRSCSRPRRSCTSARRSASARACIRSIATWT